MSNEHAADASGPDDQAGWTMTPQALSIGGQIKTEPEDFVVEEIPAYEPSGEGEHLFLFVQKRDISAESLLEHLSRVLSIPREEIGMAGMKDRRAVTRQWVSVPASVEPAISHLETELIHVLNARRHGNKLKTGHLQGNRFEIVVRDVEPNAAAVAAQVTSILKSKGVPNYFGDQRFGIDNQTLTLGRALLSGESTPRNIPFRRRKFLTRLALSAVQSDLFNQVLLQRMNSGNVHRVLDGDVMQVVATGGLFVAEEIGREQIRLIEQETVITGPLFGPKMKSPVKDAFELEQQVLSASGLTRDMFRAYKKLTPGGRRPLLLFLKELEIEEVPEGLKLKFSLPSGAYATVIMREFMKSDESRLPSASAADEEPVIADDDNETDG